MHSGTIEYIDEFKKEFSVEDFDRQANIKKQFNEINLRIQKGGLISGNQDEAPIQIVKTASSQVTLDELQVLLNKVGEKATENAVNIKLNLDKIKVLQKKVDMGSEFKGQEVTPAAAVDDIQFQELEYKFATLEK